MNTRLSIPSLLALVLMLLLTAGCKIEITVPEGGKVVSASHAYDCDSGKTCVVEVNDFQFAETFDAHADEGWIFVGWKLGWGYLCARSESICHLSNKGLGQYEAISAWVESDDFLFLEPEFVKGTPLNEALAKVSDERLRNCLWKVPPPRRYAEQIRNMDCIYRIGSLQGIEAFNRIEHLGLKGDGSLTDLQPLGKLSHLQNLDLSLDASYFNAAALGELKLLDYLSLSMTSGSPNQDLTEMGHLQSLRELTLSAYPLDLNSIGSLVNLRKLTANGVNDIGPLAGLTNLKDLNLSYLTNQISDIGPLAGLTNLETLNLSGDPWGGNQISDIGALARLTNLKYLNLGLNQVSDTGPLSGLTNLEYLNLDANPIKDIGQLAGMTHLVTLKLRSNQISDIRSVAGMSKLETLDLSHNQISDIPPLAGMTNLGSLDLSHNQISDIRPLAGMTNLGILDLSHNQISDIHPLAEIDSIPILVLDDNLLRDVSPLKQHYPFALDPSFHVRLGLSYNPISSIGDALDGIRSGRVGLTNVQLSCQEYSRLAERYASRWILTDYYKFIYSTLTPGFIYPAYDSLVNTLYDGYKPPRECL